MDEKKEMTLEEGLEELDRLTKKMEESEIPLEERFELYKKGVELIKLCSGKIDLVEKELQIVREESVLTETDE